MDVKAVSRELRASLWPALRRYGFDARTDRGAWRYWEGGVDVIDVTSIGAQADACGCTTFSFGAMVGSIPGFLGDPPARSIGRDGRPRPHYWNCQLVHELRKTLRQPWFHPFNDRKRTLPTAMRLHRKALMQVLRREIHDRSDIWFVRDDGSNLVEAVRDLLTVIEGDGLPTLAQFHKPCSVIEMVKAGSLSMTPDSPAAVSIIDAARRLCPAD